MTANPMAAIGDVIKMIRAEGMAPIKGPKYGIILVIPTIKLINSRRAYGNTHEDKAEEADDERVNRSDEERERSHDSLEC
ncbi:MAG: hypothetical protein ACLTXL_07165 [Clostridia bacterium]